MQRFRLLRTPTEETLGLYWINMFSATWRENNVKTYLSYLLIHIKYLFWTIWNYLYEYSLLIMEEYLILFLSHSFKKAKRGNVPSTQEAFSKTQTLREQHVSGDHLDGIRD